MNAKNAALGDRIRQARKTLGLTQQEFAAQLEVTQPTVHRWEKGFYDPDEEALQRLAGMTKMSPAYFRYGENGSFVGPVSCAITGYVDSDGEVHRVDNRNLEIIEAPPGVDAIAALRVRGDGLMPIHHDGDTIFYAVDKRLSEAEFIARECVVKLAGGPTLLKRVARGTQNHRYVLTSHDTPPISNVRLEWASPVLWIRR